MPAIAKKQRRREPHRRPSCGASRHNTTKPFDPTVLDRVIQQALAQVLEPLFDPEFSDRSYGFRKRRGAHDAVKQAREYLKQGYPVAVDMDLCQKQGRAVEPVPVSGVHVSTQEDRLVG